MFDILILVVFFTIIFPKGNYLIDLFNMTRSTSHLISGASWL